jgi:hypothetical protein
MKAYMNREDRIGSGKIRELLLYLRGVAHGRQGLIKKTGDGAWTSPFVVSEGEKTRQSNLAEWQEVEAAAASLFIAVAGKEGRVRLLAERVKSPAAHNRLIGGIKASIDADYAAIAETENVCRIRCERRLCVLKSNLAVYWSGVLKTHPRSEELPVELPAETDTGESVYRAKHCDAASFGMCAPSGKGA